MNDAGQVIRRYLAVTRRQWWVIAQAAVVVGMVAALVSSRSDDPPYRASTTILLQSESSTTVRPQQADLLLAKRNRELYDPAVLDAAAAAVPGETAASIAAAISSTPNSVTGTIVVTATTPEAERPTAIANAVAEAFIADQRAKLTSSARASLGEAEKRRDILEKSLVDLRGTTPPATGAAPATGDAASVQREAVVAQLSQVYQTIEGLKLQIDAASPLAEVLFPATGAAPAPRTPPWKAGLQGAAAGIVVGIGLAALREVLDTKLRDRDAVERELPWPVLAELLDADAANAKPLVSHDLPTGPVAETMRRLRTNLRFIGGDNPIRCLVVTSPQPGDGKSFVATNLAIAYAQLGARTVLVSGDLRRPSIDAHFIAKNGPGLCDLLVQPAFASASASITAPAPTAAAGPEAVLRFAGVPNLWVLPAGEAPANPAELLAGAPAAAVFEGLRGLADIVIVDAPPLVVVDPVLLGGHADGLLLVASLGKTQRAATRHARHTLETSGLPVFGVVLNRMRVNTTDGYGAYSYEYTPRATADASTGKRRFLPWMRRQAS